MDGKSLPCRNLLDEDGSDGYNLWMAKRSSQLEMLPKRKDVFGGSLLKGNPKTKRPLDSKLPIHLTLRATKSGMRAPRMAGVVDGFAHDVAKKYGVKIYEYANVGNHIHILLKLPSLRVWAAFIRELTGRIAAAMKTFLKLDGQFWLYRPHTRIIRGWKQAYEKIKLYVRLNQLEADGHVKRPAQLKKLRPMFSS